MSGEEFSCECEKSEGFGLVKVWWRFHCGRPGGEFVGRAVAGAVDAEKVRTPECRDFSAIGQARQGDENFD